MKSKLKRIIAALFISISLVSLVNAQAVRYKITSHEELAWAQHPEDGYKDKARAIAQNFFDQASRKNYHVWLEQLSDECFINDSIPKKETTKWWSDLTVKKQTYEFTHEGPSVNARLKILYFAPGKNKNKGEKQVVMVKEHGEWKVYSMN